MVFKIFFSHSRLTNFFISSSRFAAAESRILCKRNSAVNNSKAEFFNNQTSFFWLLTHVYTDNCDLSNSFKSGCILWGWKSIENAKKNRLWPGKFHGVTIRRGTMTNYSFHPKGKSCVKCSLFVLFKKHCNFSAWIIVSRKRVHNQGLTTGRYEAGR